MRPLIVYDNVSIFINIIYTLWAKKEESIMYQIAKKFRICLFFIIFLIIVATAFTKDKGKIKLKNAYKSGKIALIFTGKDEGEKLVLKIINLLTKPQIIVVEKGMTSFEFLPPINNVNTISFISERNKELKLSAEGDIVDTFSQTGKIRFKSVIVTGISKGITKPKTKKE